MNASVPVRRSPSRLLIALLVAAMLPLSGLFNIQTAAAAYQLRYTTITTGALTFTGNTLGLSKANNANAPGTLTGIGTFITTNTAVRDGTYPFGTTANWALDSSAANLTMPAGSTVRYAELIWSGSYSYAGEDVSAALNNSVSFTTPGGQTFIVTPDPLTAQTLGTKGINGTCDSDPVTPPNPPPPGYTVTPCFYVRSANVTAQVQAAGPGTYTAGGIPATQANAENFKNNAGWTLAVAYENSALPARNLSLFVGAEVTNASTSTPVTITGFCTPPSGPVSGRLLLSASEGDSNIPNDQMQFGPDAATLTPISGPNRPVNNFFASQINDDIGNIDTSGTFGTVNHPPGGSISGARQGWDIANVDISAQLGNDQRSAVARGTSTQDQYVINGLGTQIGVGAPQFPPNVKTVDKAQTYVGDFLTYTIRVDNRTGTANADNLIFKDTPPAGTSFVPGSFTIDGVAQPGADPAAGVNMGTIALGTQKIVTFQVRVDALPVSSAIQFDNSASWTYDYISCAGQAPIPGTLITNQVRTTAPLLQPSKSVSPIGPVAAGTQLTYTINVPNNGTAATIGTTLQDSIPAGTTYVPNSTTLNGSAAGLGGAVMPFTTARLINSPSGPPGVIVPGEAAVVQFRVTVNPGVTASINNIALIDQDGPGGPIPPVPTQTSNPVALLASTKSAAIVVDTAPAGGSPGDRVEYTIRVTNSGSGPATGVNFNDIIPANSAYVPNSTTLNGTPVADVGGTMPYVAGQAINSPGSPAGTIASGGTATIVFRVDVNNPLAAGVTRLVNQGTVTSNEVPPVKTDDPNTPTPDDPTIVPLTSAAVLSADKAVTIVNDTAPVGGSPGDRLRYTVTIINSGNSAATNVIFNDTPDPNTTLVNGSVTTSQGTIAGGNTGTPPVIVNIGTIPGTGGRVTITFEVDVASPLPAGVNQVANQGTVSSDQLPAVPTNDPATPAPGDPTITPLIVEPVLEATKQATLFVDADRNGVVSPGDTILYDIIIRNTGNALATGVIYNDTPDANTTLVAGSVQTSTGAITSGNTGTPPVTVNIGNIPAGASVMISYKVTINNPLQGGVVQVVNQGLVTSNELPPVPTSDPNNPVPGSPTIVPVVAVPVLAATKTDTLLNDTPPAGASSGDTLLYIVTINNTGNTTATAVLFNDTPDSNTTLVVGSVQTNLGTVTKGNTAGDTSLSVDIGALPIGASVSISFRVTINTPVPAGVTQLANQGIVSASNSPTVLTDDPDTAAPGDPTVTPLAFAPVIDATKTAQLFADVDADGVTSPGDILLYNVTIRNSGNTDALNVVFNDLPDSNTTLVVGSAQTSQGIVTAGNTAGDTAVGVDIGTIPPGGSVSISFRAVINDPLPPGVTRVINQGIISGSNFPTVPTDDPTTPAPGDPTVTPITLAPRIIASKIDKLFTDADNNRVTSPGDTLLYQVTIQNTGNGAAPGIIFSDVPDVNTKLVVGSVQTSQGSITKGNTAGDTAVGVDIGTIPARGANVTISFLVTINNPLPAGVVRISNQGVAAGTTIPAVPTDDPNTPTPGDPTITPVVAAPVLIADKAVSLLADPDNNGVASPGDTLVYQVTIQNTGNTQATGVTYSDAPDANTTLVVSSVQTSQGAVTGGNAGIPPVTVNIGVIPAGVQVTITYHVTINNPLSPPTATRLENQGLASSNELPPVPTNDPTTAPVGDPTITPLAAGPILAAQKSALLYTDANGNGVPSVNDTLLYVITIANSGTVSATGVLYNDTPDVITTLVVGSVKTSQGSVTKGNTAGDTSLTVNIGAIPAGASVTISYLVTINSPFVRSVILNQGTVTSNELPPVPTDDPSTAAPGDPTAVVIPPGQTAITLSSFTATRRASDIVVNWVTTSEINTWGFHLYRSADGSRAGAVRVTAAIIPGQGRGQGGAAYTWLDQDAQPGVAYSYWLQEVELNGTTYEYGPATAGSAPAAQHSIFLPIAFR